MFVARQALLTVECRKCTVVEPMGDRERERLGWASRTASFVVVVVIGFAPAPAATAAGVCNTEVVRNYLKPVEGLPDLRKTDDLPFGPSGLFLEPRGQSPLMLPGNHDLGYTVSFRRGTSNGRPNPHLNWLVTAKLARLNRRGVARRALGWDRKRITSLGPRRDVSLRLPSSVAAGLYRLEIVFRNGADKRLGRFGEYVRVLRPTGPTTSRLTLNKTSFLPGETVSAEAEEHGIGWLEVSDVYSIETYDGSTWTRAPISPKGVSLLIGTLIGPGEATSVSHFNPSASCWSFTIPSGAPPGLYRFVVNGNSMSVTENRLTPDTPLTLTSEFQILPG